MPNRPLALLVKPRDSVRRLQNWHAGQTAPISRCSSLSVAHSSRRAASLTALCSMVTMPALCASKLQNGTNEHTGTAGREVITHCTQGGGAKQQQGAICARLKEWGAAGSRPRLPRLATAGCSGIECLEVQTQVAQDSHAHQAANHGGQGADVGGVAARDLQQQGKQAQGGRASQERRASVTQLQP